MATPAEIDETYKSLLWIGAGAAAITYGLTGAYIYTRPTELVAFGGHTVNVTQYQTQALLSLATSVLVPRIIAGKPRVLKWLQSLLGWAGGLKGDLYGDQLDRIEKQGAEILNRVKDQHEANLRNHQQTHERLERILRDRSTQ